MKRGLVIGGIFAVALVVGFLMFMNNSTIYNLTDEFGLTGRVVDYGIYGNDKSYEDIVRDFAEEYPGIAGEEKVYFIFGNREEVEVLSYEEILRGNLEVVVGGENQRFNVVDNTVSNQKFVPLGNKVKVVLEGKSYEFNLKDNQNVYFVVKESDLKDE